MHTADNMIVLRGGRDGGHGDRQEAHRRDLPTRYFERAVSVGAKRSDDGKRWVRGGHPQTMVEK